MLAILLPTKLIENASGTDHPPYSTAINKSAMAKAANKQEKSRAVAEHIRKSAKKRKLT